MLKSRDASASASAAMQIMSAASASPTWLLSFELQRFWEHRQILCLVIKDAKKSIQPKLFFKIA